MKRLFLFILMCAFSISLFSQKVVDNPKFKVTTAAHVKITKVEIRDTCTVLSFNVSYSPGAGFRIPKESYIQVKDGEKLTAVGAEGAELDGSMVTPESGENYYKLIFPAIDQATALIDFGEGESGDWYIFEIELIPQKKTSVFPEEIQGNWFKTNGSGEWLCGFLKNGNVIYQSEVYSDVTLNKKGKKYNISLRKNNIAFDINAKSGKDNTLSIGLNPDEMITCSRIQKFDKDYVIPENEDFKTPLIGSGTALYRGYLNGYIDRLGATGMLYVNEVMENSQNPVLIPIMNDGSFEVEIPVRYPKSVLVDIVGFRDGVFLEAGKSVFHCIDLTGDKESFISTSSLFMGEEARVNFDLAGLKDNMMYDFRGTLEKTGIKDKKEYRDKTLEILETQLNLLDQLYQDKPFTKKAYTMCKWNLPYLAYLNILSYSNPMQPRQAKRPELPDSTFFRFLPESILNNQFSLVTNYAFDGFTNRLFFSNFIRGGRVNIYPSVRDSLKSRGIAISANESLMIDSLTNNMSFKADSISAEVKEEWTAFTEKNKDLTYALSISLYHEQNLKNMKHYTGIGEGFMMDINLSQRITGIIKGTFKPLNKEMRLVIDRYITSPEIKGHIFNVSREMEEEIAAKMEANKKKTGYILHDLPTTKADSIFEAIVSQYPGKVLFIDIWATWCSPCKDGIKRMKPLKEEFKGKDIEFIYIAEQSSPIDTYNLLIPDIKGQHYRLDKDSYHYIKDRFKLSGIPRYMLVGKDGKMIKDNLWTESFSNETLRDLFNEHLE